MPLEPEIRITGTKVRVQQGKKKLADIPVEQLIDTIYGGCERACRFEIRPQTARIWEVKTFQLLHTLRGHSAPVRAIAFRPDGRRLLTASDDHTARLWGERE